VWGKYYSSFEEEEYRKSIFLDNLKLIKKLNAESQSTKFAVNQFADLTEAEFNAIYLTKKKVPENGTYLPFFEDE